MSYREYTIKSVGNRRLRNAKHVAVGGWVPLQICKYCNLQRCAEVRLVYQIHIYNFWSSAVEWLTWHRGQGRPRADGVARFPRRRAPLVSPTRGRRVA
jgi:hypothetical protein